MAPVKLLYIQQYEDVNEDELESVVNLSSCKIVKDKKGIFGRERCFGSIFNRHHDIKQSDDYKLKKKREKKVSLSSESDEDSDTDQRDTDYGVLKDMSNCVVSFLEEGEPEPSDAETLSSTSTSSYETILSDVVEDNTQGSNSQENTEFGHTADNRHVEEHIYDEIDGSSGEEGGEVIHFDSPEDSRFGPPCPPNKMIERKHKKSIHRRSDETFIVEDHAQSGHNRIEQSPYHQTCTRDIAPECRNNSHVENYAAQHDDVRKTNFGPNAHKNDSNRINVKRISTQFTPFTDLHNRDRGDFVHKISNKESPSAYTHHRDDTEEDRYTDSSMFSSLDSSYPNYQVNQMHEIKDKREHRSNKFDASEYKDNRGDSSLDSKKQNLEWLYRKFSPKQRLEQRGIQKNDLSPSHRKRGSPQSLKKVKNLFMGHAVQGSCSGKDNSVERNGPVKIVTPFHHRQARKMAVSNLKSSPLQQAEMHVTNSNETVNDSLHEDNRSSKKDSGFSTLLDESLTINTPLYEEVPEILTLENLDSFNKSMADQSTFANVSVNCSDSKVEEKNEKVEKWLLDVSVEMEKETETTIDRKVDRISEEICKNGRGGTPCIGMEKNNRLNKHQVNRQRHSSAEMVKKTEECLDTVVSKSCQPLQKHPNSNQNSDLCRNNVSKYSAQNNDNYRHGERHTLRGHRSLTQNYSQMFEKQKFADMMRMFGQKESDNYNQDEVIKQRFSEFSGKRLIENSNGMVYIEDQVDGMPTPPKSRRLNENMTGPFKQKARETNFKYSDKYHKSPGQRKHESLAEHYIDDSYRDEFNLEKQEMLAYMIPNNFQQPSEQRMAKIKEIRQTQMKDSPDKKMKACFRNQERTRGDIQVNSYGHVFNADQGGKERDDYFDDFRDRVQVKLNSPTNEARSLRDKESRSSHRNEKEVHSPYTYHTNKYDVNQSYVRKLKQNSERKNTEARRENQYYADFDEESDDGYEIQRNKNWTGEEPVDFQQSLVTESRHRQPYRNETNQPVRRKKFELDEKYAIAQRHKDVREEHDTNPRESLSHIDVRRQHHQKRSGNEHYTDTDRGMYDEQGRGDQNFGSPSPKVKNLRRKSSERSDRTMYRDGRNSTSSNMMGGSKFIRNDTFTDNCGSPSKRYGVKERYDVQDLFNDEVDQVGEVYETSNVSPRTEIKRYHMECHLGDAHWLKSRNFMDNFSEARSPQGQRNNNAEFRENRLPLDQVGSRNLKDTGYRSPSTRQDVDVRYGSFKSPDLERTKQTRMNIPDEYSPSASLAKMRLNTPKSKSEGRQKQYRRSDSRAEHFRENDEGYQTIFYNRSDGQEDFVNDVNQNSITNVSVRVNHPQLGRRIDNSETERTDVFGSSETKNQDQSARRFVSLDQLQGMPLQLRIQQLESGHIRSERHARGRQQYRSRECSNEYICDNLNRGSNYYENEQKENSVQENMESSNVYHKYCEVINEKDRVSNQSANTENTLDDNDDYNDERNGKISPRATNEPKMRKSLFSPSNTNFRHIATSQDRRTVLQSSTDFDVFKTPMSPPVVARNKLKKHNKENEHDVNKVSQQKSKCASNETAKLRDRLSNIHANSGPVKMSPAQYMQSTPIKPGAQFTLNTTMSTILGSDETEINNDVNEEIVLI